MFGCRSRDRVLGFPGVESSLVLGCLDCGRLDLYLASCFDRRMHGFRVPAECLWKFWIFVDRVLESWSFGHCLFVFEGKNIQFQLRECVSSLVYCPDVKRTCFSVFRFLMIDVKNILIM